MSATDIGRNYINPTMPQLIADLLSSITIKVPIYLVAATAVDRRPVLGDLLIAFTCVSSSQLMKAFEVMRVQDIPRWSYYVLPHAHVAFVGRNQISATRWRNPLCKSKRIANMLIHCNPAWR